jgi:type VII secretion protein EccB
MASERDQVQAYTFLVSRLNSALVEADADAPRAPLHRTSSGAVIGLALGLIAAAGLFVWSFVSPSAPSAWRTDGTVVVDSGTGARYVYSSGVLYPVLNYASALLVGSGKPLVPVPDRNLAALPHGQPVGIVGAPDSLPAAARLDTGAWLVCASARTAPDGTRQPLTTLRIGAQPEVRPTGGQALTVTDASGIEYLVWNGTRLRVGAPWALAALGLAGVSPVAVDAAFLDAVPAGADLASPDVGTIGAAGPTVNGTRTKVGQVFVVREAGLVPQYFATRADGLAPLSDTAADLLLNDPAVKAGAYGGGPVAPTVLQGLAGVPEAATAALGAGLPATPPQPLITAPGNPAVPCARIAFVGAGQQVDLVTAPSSAANGMPAVGGAGILADARNADAFAIAPGAGVFAASLTGGAVPGDAHYLISDSGVKYPVASATALGYLGYRGSSPVQIPQTLLDLLPTGPALAPASAAAAVPELSASAGP